MIDRFSWIAFYPEIVLLVMACVIALVDLLDKSQRDHAGHDQEHDLRVDGDPTESVNHLHVLNSAWIPPPA